MSSYIGDCPGVIQARRGVYYKLPPGGAVSVFADFYLKRKRREKKTSQVWTSRKIIHCVCFGVYNVT